MARSLEKDLFQRLLLNWYQKNKRTMPWRDDPTPYHVWISEIMLQQTRVEAVREYYQRFIEKLPDIRSLSKVDDETLHKLWEGLGYYNRAKNLKKAAELIEKEYGGELPSCYEMLLKLPGIGPYTAGAIASIAFFEPVPAVDGNVMRVIARLTGDDREIDESSTKKAMEEVVRELIPSGEVQHFNQAFMELGALVCIPNGKAKCDVCPVRELCFAYKNGKQGELPVKKAKKERKKEKRTILLFKNEEGKVHLRKRGEKGLLSGLWEFPSLDGSYTEKELEDWLKKEGIAFSEIKRLKKVKHIFTHIEWDMIGYLIVLKVGEMGGEKVWVSLTEMKEKYSIPSAFGAYKKYLEKIL